MKSMNFDKMFKKLETSHILAGLALVVLIWALMKYSNDKNTSNFASAPSKTTGNTQGAPVVQNDDQSTSVSGASAADLLPKDGAEGWGKVAPSDGLKNVNLLTPSARYGINTVGNSLRNANMQLRKDPPIAKRDVGPWNGTTMDGDTSGLECNLQQQ